MSDELSRLREVAEAAKAFRQATEEAEATLHRRSGESQVSIGDIMFGRIPRLRTNLHGVSEMFERVNALRSELFDALSRLAELDSSN
jgi:hypothetical protein